MDPLASRSLDEWEEIYHRQQAKLSRASDILLGDIAKPPPLVHGLLLDNTLTMISAEPFSGKTLLTLALALALDSGSALFGHYEIREKKRVLYLGQDAPSWDYAEQLRKLARGYQLSSTTSQSLNMDLMLNQGLNFFDPKSWKIIQDWWEISHFNVLMIDTLASFHAGDENSIRDMGILCAMLKEIRDRMKCAVIFTHHSAKPSQGVARSENYSARGSSVISGSIDFHLVLRRQGELDRLKISLPKGRGAERMDKLTYFDIVENEVGALPAIKLTVPNQNDTRTGRLLAALTTPKHRHELITVIQASEPALTPMQAQYATDNSLTSLVRAGKVRRVGRATYEAT